MVLNEEIEVQDHSAKYYEKRYTGTGFLLHARITTEMLEGIKFRDGRYSDKVLELGCGTGFLQSLYPNFDITGLDISDEMLKRNPFQTKKGSAESIPFPDNHFDFVVCRGLLHHLRDPALGVRESYRVLKPGGRFVCWETNESVINSIARKLAIKLTSRFSRDHKNFKINELRGILTDSGLKIESEKFIGYIGYALAGFPDMIDLRLPIWVGDILFGFDNWLSKTPLKELAWTVMIKAKKL